MGTRSRNHAEVRERLSSVLNPAGGRSRCCYFFVNLGLPNTPTSEPAVRCETPPHRVRREPSENVLSSLLAPLPGAEIPSLLPSVALSFRDVTHSYGRRIALDRLNLEVLQGEVLALLGPNGAGKSTTISALLGLVRPQEGRIEVLGSDPRQSVADGRVGAMLQSGSGVGLPPGVRVDQVLGLVRRLYPRPAPRDQIVERARTSERSSSAGPIASQAARPNGSVSPSRSPATPRSCSSTSRPLRWTWSPARPSGG